MKQYFYDIKEIEFIYKGEWNDFKVKYKGKKYNYYMLEDILFNIYKNDNPNIHFYNWVRINSSLVFEILETI